MGFVGGGFATARLSHARVRPGCSPSQISQQENSQVKKLLACNCHTQFEQYLLVCNHFVREAASMPSGAYLGYHDGSDYLLQCKRIDMNRQKA